MFNTLLKKSMLVVFCFLWINNINCQVPFSCDGSVFTVKNNKLYNLDFNWGTGETRLTPFPGSIEYLKVGSLGYSSEDNFIYGIAEQDNLSLLLQIDSNGEAFLIDTLDITGWEQSSSAGAVSTDGKKYFFKITNINPPNLNVPSSAIGIVDLGSPNLELKIDPLKTQVGVFPLLLGDLAFDPLTDSLLGFSHFPINEHRLVYLNWRLPGYDNTSFPVNNSIISTSGIFFDTFGDLWGFSANSLFRFNKTTGSIQQKMVQNLDHWDACSCPFTVQMQKTVSQDTVFQCSEAFYTFRIANLTKSIQSNIVFRDSFPPGFEVQEIIRNPFGGNVNITNSNDLIISGMEIPFGVDSIIVKVFISQELSGLNLNQACLKNLDLSAGNNQSKVIYSDNPLTIDETDPTPIFIQPFEFSLTDQIIEICKDSIVQLNPIQNPESFQFFWSDGSTNSTLIVDQPGIYNLTITSQCFSDSAEYEIRSAELAIDLGGDDQVIYGDVIEILPIINSSSLIENYVWEENGIFLQDNQKFLTFTPLKPTSIRLTVTDENGCQSSQIKNIQVIYDVYFPNAFSPNGDGKNDSFYLQTKNPVKIISWLIFNRWGELVFQKQNILTNNSFEGWNGKFNNLNLPTGIYVWRAVLEFDPENRINFQGDILIVR